MADYVLRESYLTGQAFIIVTYGHIGLLLYAFESELGLVKHRYCGLLAGVAGKAHFKEKPIALGILAVSLCDKPYAFLDLVFVTEHAELTGADMADHALGESFLKKMRGILYQLITFFVTIAAIEVPQMLYLEMPDYRAACGVYHAVQHLIGTGDEERHIRKACEAVGLMNLRAAVESGVYDAVLETVPVKKASACLAKAGFPGLMCEDVGKLYHRPELFFICRCPG